jgi:hypothetical protein
MFAWLKEKVAKPVPIAPTQCPIPVPYHLSVAVVGSALDVRVAVGFARTVVQPRETSHICVAEREKVVRFFPPTLPQYPTSRALLN